MIQPDCPRQCHSNHQTFETRKVNDQAHASVACFGHKGKQAVVPTLVGLLIFEIISGAWLIACFRVFGLLSTATPRLLRCQKIVSYVAAFFLTLALVALAILALNLAKLKQVNALVPYTNYFASFGIVMAVGLCIELYSVRVFNKVTKIIEDEVQELPRVVYPQEPFNADAYNKN